MWTVGWNSHWRPHEYGTVVVTNKPTLLLIDLWFIFIIILWTSEGFSLRFVPAYFQMSLVSPSLFWLSSWLVSECQFWNTTNFKLLAFRRIMWLDDCVDWIEKDVKGNDYGLFVMLAFAWMEWGKPWKIWVNVSQCMNQNSYPSGYETAVPTSVLCCFICWMVKKWWRSTCVYTFFE